MHNYNREPAIPNSWWGGICLVPTDSYVNAQKGNNPYGEVGTATYTSGKGSKLGLSSTADYSGTVFDL